jgi:protein-S-isoprenylcysteine O-methyltransferase Ste14
VSGNENDQLRIKYGFWIVFLGLVVAAAVFFGAIFHWTAAADVATAVGSVTGVIGTVVGAFFGIQAGSEGKEQVEAARVRAETNASRLALVLPPDVAASLPLIKGSGTGNQIDQLRIKYRFLVEALGLVLVAAVFFGAIFHWTAAADVATAVGSVTGVIGTIVGAFFGIQAGSEGKEQAETARVKAETNAFQIALALPPNVAAQVQMI